MKILTFYDFTFRAYHSLAGHSDSASHPHWHTYVVRFWFTGFPDQDHLSKVIEARYVRLHGADIDAKFVTPSTDENMAASFLGDWADAECVRVQVTNDGRRGAEAEL